MAGSGPDKTLLAALASALAIAAPVVADGRPRFDLDGFRARMALEAGHLVKGEFRRAGDYSIPLEFVALNRNIVFLDQGGRLGDDWEFDAGLMGVLWWPFTPETGGPATRTVRVDPRVSVLKARRYLGGDGAPAGGDRAYLDFGYFPYKYNPEAANLGEYLYRSGTYPGVVATTDGYELQGRAFHYVYGAHLHAVSFGGRLAHAVNLFTEPVTDPIGDLTPAYEAALTLGPVTLGAGAAWNRAISFKPSATRPRDAANAYIEFAGDSARGIPYYKGPYLGAPDLLQGDTAADYKVLHRWTHRGLKLMGRAAVDLGFLLPENLRSPRDLRLFAEAAVLGWENQPYYYEERRRRIPVMLGMNLPTFRLLDLLQLQVEHYDALFNDTYYYSFNSLPIWTVKDHAAKDLQWYKRSPWRWSAQARKSVNRLASFSLQVASDHLRMRDLLTSPTEYEVTLYPGNWYYLMRMEIGI